MRTLVVYESHFGNGARIAAEIADETGGTAVAVADAPAAVPADVDLLVAGGPTHGLTLSSAISRTAAHAAGGADDVAGLGDWLRTVEVPGTARVALFTTHSSPLSGSAAKAARRVLARRGIPTSAVQAFVVTSQSGPLKAGETARARDWARSLRA